MDIQKIICLLTIFTLQKTLATRHVVYWDKNMIPRLLTNDGLEITVEIDDWMDVLCPYIADGESSWEYEVKLHLYNVTKQAYMNCDTRNGIRLQSCDDPFTEKKLTTKFQERSPYPFGFTFRPGSTYYYISKPLYDSSIGCTDETLKMKVNVERKDSTSSDSNSEQTITYHIIHTTDEDTTRSSTVEDISDKVKKARRHHHHERFKKQTTTSPKIAIKIVKSKPGAVSDSVRSDGPENHALSTTRPKRTSNFLLIILTAFSTNFLFVKSGTN